MFEKAVIETIKELYETRLGDIKMQKLPMKELYKKRNQFLRIKEKSSQLAADYDEEIERRKNPSNQSSTTKQEET